VPSLGFVCYNGARTAMIANPGFAPRLLFQQDLKVNGQEIATRRPQTIRRAHRPAKLAKRTAWAHHQEATLAKHKRFFDTRRQEIARWAGGLTWLTNSAPDSLVTFLRADGESWWPSIFRIDRWRRRWTLLAADFIPSAGLLTGTQVSTALSAGRVSFAPHSAHVESMVLKSVGPAF